MKIIKTVFRKIRDTIWGSPLQNAQTALLLAVQQHARADADVTYEKSLAAYYEATVAQIDPHRDWWHFAKMKQAWANHTQNVFSERMRRSAAEARRDAAVTRLERLRKSERPAAGSMPHVPPAAPPAQEEAV